MDNPSGVGGLAGMIADRFDAIPVKGVFALLVTVGGIIVAALNGGLSHGDCSTDPLKGVYRPARLKVVDRCAEVTGTVVAWRHEHDGDYHVSMRMDEPGWVNAKNVDRQKGYTVVEFIPTNRRPRFYAGQRLKLRVTKVLDLQHGGWVEGHPVWDYRDVTRGPIAPVSGPNRPGLAPQTED